MHSYNNQPFSIHHQPSPIARPFPTNFHLLSFVTFVSISSFFPLPNVKVRVPLVTLFFFFLLGVVLLPPIVIVTHTIVDLTRCCCRVDLKVFVFQDHVF